MRVEIFVEEDVAGLDVAVEHALLAFLVKVRQGARNTAQYRVAHVPAGQFGVAVAALEKLIEAAVGHVIVNEKQVAPLMAPPLELHEVAVADAADDGDLGQKLPLALIGVVRDLLHGNNGSIRQRPLEHAPERATP